MTTTGFHIAAQYETAAEAHAARDALVAAGVNASSILVLDKGYAARPAASPDGLWGTLKTMLVPDYHAHAYAEGVARGHPLLLADVSDAGTQAALTALKSSNPIDIESRAETWADEGWNGVNSGQDYWLDAQSQGNAAGSGGITAGGVMSGDYGSVGAPHGGRADTNILRGVSRFAGRPDDGELVNDDPSVRVYQVG